MNGRDWIEAGWFLVESPAADRWPGPPAPRGAVTVSTCVLDTWPDAWAVEWAAIEPAELARVRSALALDDRAFADLRAWVTRALADERYGWPNVFLDPDSAREFHRRFMRSAPRVRLVGIALDAHRVDAFLHDAGPRAEDEAPNGTWSALARRNVLGDPGTLLGFDVLAPDVGGLLHTHACYGLHADLAQHAGIEWNEHALVVDRVSAERACGGIGQCGETPVNWYAFRVAEYALDR